jgi:hypothetical protein
MPGPGTGPRPGGWETLVYTIAHHWKDQGKISREDSVINKKSSTLKVFLLLYLTVTYFNNFKILYSKQPVLCNNYRN